MANTTIPNLPAAVSLDGTEQLEVVQNGTSKRVTADQIAALAENTQGTVTEINTAGALTGGPITTTGTISLPPDAVTNMYLAEMPANTLKANLTGLTANPTDVTPSDVLDTFGSAAGSMVYRGSMDWEALAPGTGGQYLSTTGATPQWVTLSVDPGQLTPTGVVPGTYGTASSVATVTVNAGGQLTAASNTLISIPSGQVTGLGTMAIQNANSVAITGGNIDGTAIGSTSASTAAFTTISAGTWNGSPIGLAYGGTGATDAPTARTNLGLGTMATQNASAVAITGGTINGVSIGGSSPQAGAFTTLSVSGNAAMSTITSGTWNGNAVGVAYGGTGATDATTARSNLSAAKSGANSDITSLSGLTTPLSAPQGGTGFSSYTEGDLLYAPTSNSLGRLNDVAVGNVLLSGGVGVAPAYGKVGLTTHVDGVLPVANGGTGAATLTGYVKGNGTSAMTASATIPNSDLQNSTIQIGSTSIALGASSSTLAGLTSVTLTQDPTLALQVSTKQYVDDQVATVSNLTYHTQVVATTTGNLNANYSNGTGGVGATLTNAGALAAFQIDNVSPTATQRVLIKDQTNAFENGIYVVSTVGDGSTPWVLTRASDYDAPGAGPNFIQTGSSVFVQGGDTWGSTSWVMVTTGTISVGSTNLVWTQTSSSGNILVNAPLSKSGNTISLGTVTVANGGTGLTSYTIGDLLYADSSSSLAKLADVATGNVLRSGGVGVAPAWGKVDLTTDVSGTLPVANGGSGTSTAFTSGSVLFAGASGVYSQNNASFYWDNVNTRLGIHTNTPDASFTLVSETQTALPPGVLPAGTDLHIVGANNADARITQDAFGTGNYPAYTGRHARGTAATPTATQSGDILSQYTGRGYGATGYNSASTGIFQFEAAENFTDTAQGTYASLRLTATGAASPAEVLRVGPIGQIGVGGSSYGTANQLLTSGGSGAAPSWQSGINVTTIDASGAVTLSTATGNIAIGTSQTSGVLTLGGASQTAAITLDQSTKTHTLDIGSGATESGATKTIALGGSGVSGSTTAINIGSSVSGATSTTTLYGTVNVNGLTASKGVFTDASSNLTSTGTLDTTQGGTGLTTFSVGDIPYYATGTALSKLSIGANGQVLTSNGTAPVWTNASSISVSTANNLAGGAAGSVPYQSGASTTTFLSIGSANSVMTSTGTAPQWVTSLTGLNGVSSTAFTNSSLTAGRVVYSTTGGAQTDNANLTYDGATFTSAGATNLATSAGSVGIGTTTPGAKLAVNGGAGTSQIRWNVSNATYVDEVATNAAANAYVFKSYDASYHVWKLSNSENMRLDASGNLGINTASPQSKLNVVDSSSSTSIGGSTAVLQVGNSYGAALNVNAGIELFGSGAPSSGLNNRSAGLYGVYEAYNAGGNAGALVLATNPAGTTSVVERMRIDSEGRVGIGGTANSFAKVEITGNLPGTAAGIGHYVNATVPNGMTANAQGFRTNIGTAAAAFTLVDMHHFYAVQGAFGATSAVTNQYGFHAASSLTGATNNYGFYSNIASGSNRWNFYAAGTASNYFGGNVGIGVTPAVPLDILCDSAAFGISLRGRLADNISVLRFLNNGNTTTYFQFDIRSSVARFDAIANIPIVLSTNNTERMRITNAGSVVAGASAALATTATDGFLYVPTCAGTPTGTPTAITGMAPIVVDTTNNKLYFYSTGVWRDAGP